METQNYVREFAFTFFSRQMLIWGITGAVVIVGLLIVLFWPPSYQAQGAIILKGSQTLEANQSLGDIRGEVNPYTEVDLFSEMEIIASLDVAVAATRMLAQQDRFDLDATDEAQLKRFAGRIVSSMSTSLVPRSSVIAVTMTWGEPLAAKDILGTVFQAYLARRQAVFNPKETEQFFGTQVELIREDLANLENRLLEITGGASVEQLNDTIRRNVELEADLRQRLSQLESDLVQQRSYVRFLESGLKGGDYNLFTALENEQLSDFSQRIQELLVEREELLKNYQPGSPPVQRSEAALKRVYEVFAREASGFIARERATLEGTEGQIDKIQQRLDEIDGANQELYQDLVEARRLDRERQVSEESYQTFARRWREAQIRNENNSDRLFKVGIIKAPSVSNTPVFPQPLRVLSLSAILGLLLGVTVGFITEFFDHSFKRPEDVDSYTGLTYLFSVPDHSTRAGVLDSVRHGRG